MRAVGALASSPSWNALATGRRPAREPLPHFAIAGTLAKSALGIGGEYAPPKGHGTRITLVFDDFPIAGEPVKNQRGCIAAYTRPAMRLADKEFGHVVSHRGIAGGGDALPGDQSKAHQIGSLEHNQRMCLIVRKPIREDLVLTGVIRAQY